jgi:hypothetical protein
VKNPTKLSTRAALVLWTTLEKGEKPLQHGAGKADHLGGKGGCGKITPAIIHSIHRFSTGGGKGTCSPRRPEERGNIHTVCDHIRCPPGGEDGDLSPRKSTEIATSALCITLIHRGKARPCGRLDIIHKVVHIVWKTLQAPRSRGEKGLGKDDRRGIFHNCFHGTMILAI